MSPDLSPLTGPPPEEVPLTEPPLERVIAQIRFPEVISVEKREFVAPFQEAIRRNYPVLRPQESRGVVLSSGGVREARSPVSWRFEDPKSGWRVTLASEFLALETTRYTNRNDFVDRFRNALSALQEHVDPTVIDRLGVRYVDRVVGVSRAELPSLARPEVSGVLGTPLREEIRHSLCETEFRLPDERGAIRTKWGWIPGGSTIDPAVLPPIPEPSWILDLDVYRHFPNAEQTLDVEGVAGLARDFAERSYSIFRWAVTDEFLRRFGGNP